MTHLHKLFIVGVFLLTGGSFDAFAQSFPQRYGGELNVCGRVSASMDQGKSLESALVDLFLSNSDQPAQVYHSIQRAIVNTAIRSCHYDGGDVVRAALRIDMNISLLILSMSESGVGVETLRDALRQAGLSRSVINDAFETASVEGQTPSPSYSHVLPPPSEVSSGLGQASPFIP